MYKAQCIAPVLDKSFPIFVPLTSYCVLPGNYFSTRLSYLGRHPMAAEEEQKGDNNNSIISHEEVMTSLQPFSSSSFGVSVR